jgi:hypothetical protein
LLAASAWQSTVFIFNIECHGIHFQYEQAFAEKHAKEAELTSLAKTTLALLGITLCKVSTVTES